ncbi:MAG: signal peptidase I [Bacteroidales bacterium]
MNIPRRRITWFLIWMLLWSMLVIWTTAYWFLLFNLIIFDYFISRVIPKLNKHYPVPNKIAKTLEWTGYIAIAIFITTAIKVLFVEAYKIPTSSMEGSLKAGDYIFVSKLAYGPKLPNTPLSWPFLPDYLPNGKKTYSEKLLKPYKRLNGISRVKRGDVIVFSFPEGDSMIVEYPGQNYYSLVRQYGKQYIHEHFNVISHPVDRRENYIKRCVGLPGDTIEIMDGRLTVNRQLVEFLPQQKLKFYVKTKGEALPEILLDSLNILNNEITYNPANSLHVIYLTIEQSMLLNNFPEVRSIQRFVEPVLSFNNPEIFPHDQRYKWTNDLFGPLVIPAREMTVKLDPYTYPVYSRAIEVYEMNHVIFNDGKYYVNGKVSETYTFKMNYYFVLGDNRHNTADSRHWGFIPEDHLLGKAVTIWLSSDPNDSFVGGLRKDRIFKRIN